LLGGPGSRPAAVDALAARTLVKGEPLAPPAGRADDFVWPRREVGREQAKGETPVASVSPDGTPSANAPAAGLKPKKPVAVQPGTPAQPSAPAQTAPPGFRNFFGFGSPQPPPPRQVQPPPRAPGVPRPPANVGRSASAPPGNVTR